MKYLRRLARLIFGCAHDNYTFPRAVHDQDGNLTGHYVCCLECGRPMAYDWQQMRLLA